MAKFTRTFITAELANGKFHTARVTVPDQLQYEATARARGWNAKDGGTGNVFIAWHALKRNGVEVGTFEEFRDGGALEVQVDTQDVDTETGLEIVEETGDPTR